jgi:hypothetical protein
LVDAASSGELSPAQCFGTALEHPELELFGDAEHIAHFPGVALQIFDPSSL